MIRIAAGDDEFPQGQRVGQHIGGGGTQSVVTTFSVVGIVIRLPGSVLFAAVIGERSVRAADQIKVPRGLLEERRCRLGTAGGRTEGAPKIAEALPGVTVFPTGVSCRGHAGEELRLLRLVADRGKHHRGDGILAVVLMVGPWFVFAVGNGAFVSEVAKEPGCAGDGLIDFRILHAAFFGEHDGQIGRQSGHVHGTVGRHGAVEFAVGGKCGEAVAEGAIHALAAGQQERAFVNRGQYLLVAGDHVIFAEENQAIAHIPRVAPVGSGGFLVRIEIRLGEAVCEVAQFWQVFRLARGEQGQTLDGSGPVGLHGFLFEHLDGTLEDAFRFLAVPRRGVAVGAHHGELQREIPHLARAPNHEFEHTPPGLRFRFLNGQCDGLARVVAKRLAIHTEDHIVHHHDPVGR